MIRSQLLARVPVENPHLCRSDIEMVVAAVFDTISAHLAAGTAPNSAHHALLAYGLGQRLPRRSPNRLGK
jgi:hypothetical protein